MENQYIYPYTAAEAKRLGELDEWRKSHKLNTACKKAVEAAIARDFDGMRLKSDCAKSVIDEYGFKRVNLVLANTITLMAWDGRFSRENKTWAKTIDVPEDKNSVTDHRDDYTVNSHPAVLDGFVNQARRAYQALGLFDCTHCDPDSRDTDYEGRVLVLSPDILKEECWRQEDQLWYAHDGFGCNPKAIGRSIRSTCLSDGEETRWNRHDFIGVLKDECIPDWAREKLEELTAPRQAQSEAPQMGGLNMT